MCACDSGDEIEWTIQREKKKTGNTEKKYFGRSNGGAGKQTSPYLDVGEERGGASLKMNKPPSTPSPPCF